MVHTRTRPVRKSTGLRSVLLCAFAKIPSVCRGQVVCTSVLYPHTHKKYTSRCQAEDRVATWWTVEPLDHPHEPYRLKPNWQTTQTRPSPRNYQRPRRRNSKNSKPVGLHRERVPTRVASTKKQDRRLRRREGELRPKYLGAKAKFGNCANPQSPHPNSESNPVARSRPSSGLDRIGGGTGRRFAEISRRDLDWVGLVGAGGPWRRRRHPPPPLPCRRAS